MNAKSKDKLKRTKAFKAFYLKAWKQSKSNRKFFIKNFLRNGGHFHTEKDVRIVQRDTEFKKKLHSCILRSLMNKRLMELGLPLLTR